MMSVFKSYLSLWLRRPNRNGW